MPEDNRKECRSMGFVRYYFTPDRSGELVKRARPVLFTKSFRMWNQFISLFPARLFSLPSPSLVKHIWFIL